MRRCYQCGANKEPAELTKVGDGEFCPACFQQLLNGAEETTVAQSHASNAEPTPDFEERRAKARASDGRRCVVCRESLAGEAAIEFLGGPLCERCHGELNEELSALEATDESEAPDTAPAPSAELDADSPAPVFTPGTSTEYCAGCERPMPGPGSYRLVDGKRYCPACWPFYSQASPKAPRVATSVSGGTRSCDCCLAELAGNEVPLDGFVLCSACRGSDQALALLIARRRHTNKLEQLRKSLVDGEDDA